nr:MAG TPA: hypothetical protein [Caudoviricetes sp.]
MDICVDAGESQVQFAIKIYIFQVIMCKESWKTMRKAGGRDSLPTRSCPSTTGPTNTGFCRRSRLPSRASGRPGALRT